MPVKWKIFRIVNYMHVAAAAGVIVFILINSLRSMPPDMFLIILLFVVCPLILATNCLINLYLLEHYFPKRQPGKRLSTWHIIFFILFTIIAAGAIIITIGLYYEAFSRPKENRFSDWMLVLSLGMLSTLSLTSIPVCFLQNALRRRINRNYLEELEDFLKPETP